MLRVDSPWIILIPTCVLVAMTSSSIYHALTLEHQSVHKLATSLIKIFSPHMPSTCRNKKDEVQVMKCFIEKGEGPIALSREELKRITRDFKEYEDQRCTTCEFKVMAASCLILSLIGLYYSLRR